MSGGEFVSVFAILAVPVLFAITVHEYAHGWVANRLGDPTAMALGRLTLNPLKHIDPVGTILVPALLLWLGGFVLGWAKPVPIDARRLRRPRRDMALVAAAGPAANLAMAVGWALAAKLALVYHGVLGGFASPVFHMGAAGVLINVVLLVLNSLPWPPLDGGRVLISLLPGPLARRVGLLEPYGLVVVLVLLATGYLSVIISPPVSLLVGALRALFDVPSGVFAAG